MRKYRIITILLLIISLNTNVFAKEKPYEVQLAKISKDGLVTELPTSSVSDDLNIEEIAETLPSAYDARNDGIISSVKNQGSHGICWSFSTGSLTETYFKKFRNKTIDYSEIQQALRLTDKGLGLDSNGNGYWRKYYSGGTWNWSTGMLINFGIKEENTTKFPFYPSDTTYFERTGYTKADLDSVPTIGMLDGAYILSLNEQAGGCSSSSITLLKNLIYQYGSVGINIYWQSGYFNSTYNEFNNTGSGASINHAVTAVGWDDTKSAFLIKNSWGPSSQDAGYFWVKYTSKDLCNSVLAITSIDDTYTASFNNYHYYNINGNASVSYPSLNKTVTAAEKYTKKNNGRKEMFKKVIFYANANTDVNIFINTTGNINDTANTVKITNSPIHTDYTGFYNVAVPNNLVLTGNNFITYMEIKSNDSTDNRTYVPIEMNTEPDFSQAIIDNRWGQNGYFRSSNYTDSSYDWQLITDGERLVLNTVTDTFKRATFKNGEGLSDTTIDFYPGMIPEDIIVPEKEGYLFLGYVDDDGVRYFSEDGEPNFDEWEDNEDITLYAEWIELDTELILYDSDMHGGYQDAYAYYSVGSIETFDYYTPGDFYKVVFVGDIDKFELDDVYARRDILGYYDSEGSQILDANRNFIPNTKYANSDGLFIGAEETTIELYAHYDADEIYISLEDPETVGYTIAYYSDEGHEHQVHDYEKLYVPSSGCTLYVKAVPKTYNVLINKNGGTYTGSTLEFTYSLMTSMVDIPTKEGHKFKGVTVNNVKYIDEFGNGIKAWDIDDTESIEAVFTWEAETYDINLSYPSTATSGTNKVTATYNSATLNPNTITLSKKVYTISVIDPIVSSTNVQATNVGEAKLLGFTNNDNLLISVKNNTNEIEFVQNVTGLTDSSQRYIYTQGLTLNAKYESPVTLKVPTYTKTGYTCTFSDGNNNYNADQYITMENQELTLTASCSANSYKIYFDLDGGSTTNTEIELGVNRTYDNFITALVNFDKTQITKTGYDFIGFYYNDTKIFDENGQSTVKYPVADSITVKARYSPKSYTLTLDNSEADHYTTTSVVVEYSGSTFTPQTFALPVKEYTDSIFSTSEANNSLDAILSGGTIPVTYEFKGFFTSDNKKLINSNLTFVNTEDYIVNNKWIYDGNITLYAKFSKSNIVLPNVSKEGYVCHYNTKADGTGTNYSAGNSVSLNDVSKFHIICDDDVLNPEAPVIRDNTKLIMDSYTYDSIVSELVIGSSTVKLIDNKGNEIENPNSVVLTRNYKIKVGNTEYGIIIAGDLDGDGKVSTLDAGKTIRRVLEGTSYILDKDQMDAADVDADGNVSTLDAGKIIRKVLEDDYKIIKRRAN